MIEYLQYGLILAVVLAYLLDLLIGDPISLPHPIVYFGRMIAFFEKRCNKGNNRMLKGALVNVGLIAGVFLLFFAFMWLAQSATMYLFLALTIIFFFYGLANRTLITEGVQVFVVLETQGLQAGRTQLSRIVGRDTSELSEQQIKKAALETMAENLSDGVVAPIFWYAVAGIPGMMTYKMINTLDSMIGYKSERYLYYGRIAAYIDDVANYIPARLTALLMVVVSGSARAFRFMFKFGRKHSSPNAGYPESALAGLLNVQFGGPNYYNGTYVDKPFIGEVERELNMGDVIRTSRINQLVCLFSVILCVVIRYVILY